LRRRFIGEAPVEADGSFNLHVPANTPIELQILDSHGLSLASCSWIWVKNNEPRGCIGCHEDPELVPENQLVAAIAKPSLELILPPERRRSVDFLRDVKPVIQARCIACHQTGGSKPWLDDRRESARTGRSDDPDLSYEILLNLHQEGNPGKVGGTRYITAGRARTSPLIWHLFGRNTSQPWDLPMPTAVFKPMPPADGVRLSEDERRIFVEWIDTGAQWDSQSSQAEPAARQTSRGTPKP
jgi:Hydrazine synthase alpha subunit middle domain